MGRRKGYDSDQVLEKAMRLFWRKGYEGTHLQELVKETGLNRFSLYKEFGGKDGLFEAAVEKYIGKLQYLGVLLKCEPLGLQNILDFVWAVMQGDFAYGCFMVNTLTQKDLIQDKIKKRIMDFVAGSETELLQNLAAAQKNGEISPNRSLSGLAKFLVIFDIGLVTYSTVEPSLEVKKLIWETYRDLLVAPSAPAEDQGMGIGTLSSAS